MLQPSLGIPLLNSLHFISLTFTGGPSTVGACLLWSKKCWVEEDNHFPQHAGYSSANNALDTVSVFSCQGTLLAHIQLVVSQATQVIFSSSAFQQPVPSPQCCQELFFPRCKILHLSLLHFMFLLSHSSSLPRSLWMAALPYSVFTGARNRMTSANL